MELCVCGLPLYMWWWFYFVLGGGGLAEKSVPRSTVAPEAGHSHLPLMGNGSPSQNWAGGVHVRSRAPWWASRPYPHSLSLQTLLPSCCPPGKLLGTDFQQWCPWVASSVRWPVNLRGSGHFFKSRFLYLRLGRFS